MINFGGHFDFDTKNTHLNDLNKIINEADFWSRDDKDSILKEYNGLKSILDSITKLKNKVESNIELINMLKTDNDDDLKNIIINDIDIIKSQIADLENILLLSGPYDACDLILDIQIIGME